MHVVSESLKSQDVNLFNLYIKEDEEKFIQSGLVKSNNDPSSLSDWNCCDDDFSGTDLKDDLMKSLKDNSNLIT